MDDEDRQNDESEKDKDDADKMMNDSDEKPKFKSPTSTANVLAHVRAQ